MGFILKLDIQQNVMGMRVVMKLKFCLCSKDDNLWDHNYKRVQAGSQQIFALVPSTSLKLLAKIIKLLFVHMCF